MDVVEDQDDVFLEVLVEGLGYRFSKPINVPGGGRLRRQLQVERVAEPLHERRNGRVGPVDPIPRPATLDRDGRRERRLAEPGAGDDRRQPASVRLLEQAFERGPAYVRGRQARRDELDAWSLQKALGG